MSSVAPQPIDMSNPAQRLSLLASIVEGSEDAILSKTLDGVITRWNAASERMFGFSALEVIGQSISCIVPESLMEEERFIIDRIRTGERLQHFRQIRVHALALTGREDCDRHWGRARSPLA